MLKLGNLKHKTLQSRLRRSYEKLSAEQRAEVNERYERHLRACAKAKCNPEPMFVFEAVDELLNGRPLEVDNVAMEGNMLIEKNVST